MRAYSKGDKVVCKRALEGVALGEIAEITDTDRYYYRGSSILNKVWLRFPESNATHVLPGDVFKTHFRRV